MYFQKISDYQSRLALPRPSSVNVSSLHSTVTLKGLRPAQYYGVLVSAFTSKGEGPPSIKVYATTSPTKENSAGKVTAFTSAFLSALTFHAIALL